jgi:type IV fimbrial biogenesis protein FimT
MTAIANQQTPAHSSATRDARPGKSLFSGFTLIELMIVLVILSVILLVAIPGFSEINLKTRLKSYANDMVTSAYLARGEAIKRNGEVRLCISTDGTTCLGSGNDWEQGWIVIAADNSVIRRQQAAENGYLMSTSTANHTLTFQSSGAASTTTVLTVCRKTPTVGSQQKEISIAFTGRPSVATTSSTTCS